MKTIRMATRKKAPAQETDGALPLETENTPNEAQNVPSSASAATQTEQIRPVARKKTSARKSVNTSASRTRSGSSSRTGANARSAEPEETRKPTAESAESVSAAERKTQTVTSFVEQKLAQRSDESASDKKENDSGRPVDYNEIKKRFKKKKSAVPQYSDVRRYSPEIAKGLSSAQVNERFSQFLFNDTNQKYSKSYASIFIGNLCTFFNLLCVLAAIALLYSGAPIQQYLFVVIFGANLAFGIAMEIKAKRKMDKLSLLTVPTAKVVRNGELTEIPSKDIVLDDVISLSLGNQVPADCILAEGFVEVNESLLTGESVPVKKEAGDLLYAGSFISSGSCKVRADKVGKNTYLNSLSAKAKKYKKPNSELMRSTKLIIYIVGFLIIPIAIGMFIVNWKAYDPTVIELTQLNNAIQRTVSVVIGMIPSGMLLLTSVALTVGILRLMKHNTLVQDLYSLEMLARVNVLCLDKTGTITDGRMNVNDCMLLNNPTDHSINEIVGSCLHSLNDNNQTSVALYNYFGHSTALKSVATLPFSSKRKLSAVSFEGIGTVAIGAPEFVLGNVPEKLNKIINQYASMGLRVLIVALASGKLSGDKLPAGFKPLALISISDNIREDAVQTIRWFKENDVDVKIISGDNPVTVSEVARRVGVSNAEKYISLEGFNEKEVAAVANKYTVFGRVTPEQKAVLVKSIKAEGNTVAMTGDGVNDILALKEADCAVTVMSGSEAAKNVSHIILTDNNFASMPKVVFEGRRVINNIQNSSSLYLMKTLFTTVFAIISIILMQQYPFVTSNMMVLEFFVIGFPTFFLSLQPNTNRVRGRFLSFVLSRAVPGAIILVLAVQSTSVFSYFHPELFDEYYTEISVYLISFAGLIMLYRVCQPFNFARAFLFIAMFAISVLCLTLLPNIFIDENYMAEGYKHVGFVQIMYVMLIVMLCIPLSGILLRISDKLNGNAVKEPRTKSPESK